MSARGYALHSVRFQLSFFSYTALCPRLSYIALFLPLLYLPSPRLSLTCSLPASPVSVLSPPLLNLLCSRLSYTIIFLSLLYCPLPVPLIITLPFLINRFIFIFILTYSRIEGSNCAIFDTESSQSSIPNVRTTGIGLKCQIVYGENLVLERQSSSPSPQMGSSRRHNGLLLMKFG